jgi:hypothetical protein
VTDQYFLTFMRIAKGSQTARKTSRIIIAAWQDDPQTISHHGLLLMPVSMVGEA